MRHVVMFSSGAGSWGCAKRVAETEGTDDLVLLFTDVNGEHPDNYRFLKEAAANVGGELIIIDNGGRTIWDVMHEARFLANTRVDVCSRVLKREPMRRWLKENCDPADTTIYLGIDWTEEHRYVRARERWLPWQCRAPLCDPPYLDKGDVLDWLKREGIRPPLLYELGFPHANCSGGCVKAGIKQFKLLLNRLPEVYAEWEQNEEAMRQFLDADVSILRDRAGGDVKPLTLRRLREKVQAQPTLFEDADWGSCSCVLDWEDAEAA